MTLTSEQQVLLKKLGDYFNNGYLSLDGVLQYIYDYSATGEGNEYSSNLDEALSYVYYYSGLYSSDENEKETRNSLLQSIIDGTYTSGSCTIDGCTGSVTPQPQSQTTSQSAEEMLKDVVVFGIANIKRENDNYDIFFKGKEVLEYKANLTNLNGVGTLDNSKIDPIFKNLFDNEEYNSHIINGTQLYHARKEGNWNSDTVYKIFDNCNFKINSIDGIRYHDTTESNETRVEDPNIGAKPDGTLEVEILSPLVTL